MDFWKNKKAKYNSDEHVIDDLINFFISENENNHKTEYDKKMERISENINYELQKIHNSSKIPPKPKILNWNKWKKYTEQTCENILEKLKEDETNSTKFTNLIPFDDLSTAQKYILHEMKKKADNNEQI